MKTVDTRGLLCPAPLIAVRREIKSSEVGDQIEVLTDNDTAYSNLVNYLTELSIPVTCSKHDFVHTITFTKPDITPSEEELNCTPLSNSSVGYSVAITSETMGDGDPKLGTILLRGYFNALLELDRLPDNIVLYNGGVKCAIDGRDTAISLAALEAKGVNITICGTCTDFYGIGDQIKIGVIGNMYKIADTLSNSSHVVKP